MPKSKQTHSDSLETGGSVKRRRKSYYSINEAAEIFGVNMWTIRLWCNKFGIPKPLLDKDGNILFTSADMNKIELISGLTKKKGMTIAGVRKRLETMQED